MNKLDLSKALLPVQKENPGLQALTILQQTGMSIDELSTARVAAVEQHLVGIQEEILAEISKLIKEKEEVAKKEEALFNTLINKQIEAIKVKAEEELKKTCFVDDLVVTGSSLKSMKRGATSYDYIISAQIGCSGAIVVLREEYSIPAETIAEADTLRTQIIDIDQKISAQRKRQIKVSDYLLNMDREERKAKAYLVAARLNSMENGKELVSEMIGNLPQF